MIKIPNWIKTKFPFLENKIKWSGTFEILTNKKNKLIINNLITNEALDQMAEILQGTSPDIEIKYLAVGTSNAAVTGSETTLGAEIFRTPIANQYKGATGKIVSEFTILNTEAVDQLEEIGIFGGTTASATTDSGLLIARVLWSKNKTADEEISIRRIDQIARS
jgi:hypothetical protein